MSIFKMVCEDCGNVVEITSPATLSCNACGCGRHKFPFKMEFECFYKHKRDKVQDSPVKQGGCNNNFRRPQPARPS